MLTEGQTLRTTSRARIRVKEFLASGGQGHVYLARHLDTGEDGILKIYNDEYCNTANTQRLEFLVSMRLGKKHAAFVAPIEAVIHKNLVGHFSRRARGVPADPLIYDESFPYVQSLFMALQLARWIELLHGLDMFHGDLHLGNIFIYRLGSLVIIELIDFDNFGSPGQPQPPAVGHELYLAPELRQAMKKGIPARPDAASENYALAVLIHQILLSKHPANGFDATPANFDTAMCSGQWLHDPLLANKGTSADGYSSLILNCELANLFRKAFTLSPSARPTPSIWRTSISQALGHVHICPTCSGPCLADQSKKNCPNCGSPFPSLSLVIRRTGARIPLDQGSIRVGRPEFNNEKTISAIHAVFRQVGPEVIVQSYGLNGTFKRQPDASWTRLCDGQEVPVEVGDQLRFANEETLIE